MPVALCRLVWLPCWLLASALAAQRPGPVDDAQLEQRITAACAALRAAGELHACPELVAQVAHATVTSAPAVPLRREPLGGAELYERIAASVGIVGHYYLCDECEQWHFAGASGFWVATDGAVATCHHVLAADDGMREAFLVVADLSGQVWPVQKVLAADVAADLCVLQTPARERVPLPLRGDVRVGERVACLSHPDHQFGFYSEGVVARHYLLREPPEAAEARAWLHVTCDFARGSSGAPVVDACGNVIGIADATTTVVYDEDADVADTQMVFKTAASARALQALLAGPAAATDRAQPR
ncbi:MAG: trypsin-like peptidase domain-containing protein [Planctomycetes bacterium]|nr:trypsin-like peptidase domain-containing protein [Planctomycetota bacterium]